ncbi:hypothetical protein K438DRAFT_257507 [Mycena galopus ATCC 62051]|nr:hypothetical protein K438DRAFT_257507 [Mycena galopus ATCC 62051]
MSLWLYGGFPMAFVLSDSVAKWQLPLLATTGWQSGIGIKVNFSDWIHVRTRIHSPGTCNRFVLCQMLQKQPSITVSGVQRTPHGAISTARRIHGHAARPSALHPYNTSST